MDADIDTNDRHVSDISADAYLTDLSLLVLAYDHAEFPDPGLQTSDPRPQSCIWADLTRPALAPIVLW